MRITGGIYSGRKLKAPDGETTRPTSDRVREALFNILVHRDWGEGIGTDPLTDARVLDAFCGTGALALESLSYGAAHATLFDQNRSAIKHAQTNIDTMGLENQCTVIQIDALQPPKATKPCTLIFLDPPYRKKLVTLSLVALDKNGWIAPKALIVAETAKGEEFAWPEAFKLLHSRPYGSTEVHFAVKTA